MTEGFVDIHTHHPKPGVLSPKTAGVHPWDAGKGLPLPDFTACDIIGETGLDFAADVDRTAQEMLFRLHLDAAERLCRPVVLHVVRGTAWKNISRNQLPRAERKPLLWA